MDYKKSASIYIVIYIIAFILVNLVSMNWFIRLDLTDNQIAELEKKLKDKEKEIMTI